MTEAAVGLAMAGARPSAGSPEAEAEHEQVVARGSTATSSPRSSSGAAPRTRRAGGATAEPPSAPVEDDAAGSR